eukprot:Rmarinus@m.27923
MRRTIFLLICLCLSTVQCVRPVGYHPAYKSHPMEARKGKFSSSHPINAKDFFSSHHASHIPNDIPKPLFGYGKEDVLHPDVSSFHRRLSQTASEAEASTESDQYMYWDPYTWYWGLCSEHLTYPLEYPDGMFDMYYTIAEGRAWAFQYSVHWSAAYSFINPDCATAVTRMICTNMFPMAVYNYKPDDTVEKQVESRKPCKSMCTDMISKCSESKDVWGGLIPALQFYCEAKLMPDYFCMQFFILTDLVAPNPQGDCENSWFAKHHDASWFAEDLEFPYNTFSSCNGSYPSLEWKKFIVRDDLVSPWSYDDVADFNSWDAKLHTNTNPPPYAAYETPELGSMFFNLYNDYSYNEDSWFNSAGELRTEELNELLSDYLNPETICEEYPDETEEECFYDTAWGDKSVPGSAVVTMDFGEDGVPTHNADGTDADWAATLMQSLDTMTYRVMINEVTDTQISITVPHFPRVQSTEHNPAFTSSSFDALANTTAEWASSLPCQSTGTCPTPTITTDVDTFRSKVPQSEIDVLDTIYETCNGENWFRNNNWDGGDVCSREGVYCGTGYGVSLGAGVTYGSCSWGFDCEHSNIDVSDYSTYDEDMAAAMGLMLCTNASPYCDFDDWWPLASEEEDYIHIVKLELPKNNLICDDGLVPDFTDLSYLEVLDIGENDLSDGAGTNLCRDDACERIFPTTLQKLGIYEIGGTGDLPSWLAELTSLTYLNLGHRDLAHSYFPHGLYVPTYLNTWGQGQSNLQEILESIFTSLSSLEVLNIGHVDAFTFEMPGSAIDTDDDGNIDVVTGVCQLQNLKELHFDRAGFIGDIPDCKYGQACDFDGDGVSDDCVVMGNLEEFYMFSNNLDGTIPDSIGNLPKLKDFFVPSNRLTGTLPYSLMCPENRDPYTALDEIVVAENFLRGTLPDCVQPDTCVAGEYCAYLNVTVPTLESLQVYSVYSNQFEGTIPSIISVMKDVWFLAVSELQLDEDSKLPDLSKLESLNQLFCEDNNLIQDIGEILPMFNNMPSLNLFQLNNNQLNGTIPPLSEWSWMCTDWAFEEYFIPTCLTNVEQIGLAGNAITGSLPDLEKAVALERLTLQGNQIDNIRRDDGEYSFCSNFRLLHLELQNNLIEDVLDPCLGRMTRLQRIHLNDNSFSGTIPTALQTMSGLQYLKLQSNNLHGPIPTKFAETLLELREIDLSGNLIAEDISSLFNALKYLPVLSIVNLAHNQIHGQLNYQDFSAGSTYYWESLTDLSYKNNSVDGELLTIVGAIATLKSLDISDNDMTGAIPDSLGDLTRLITMENPRMASSDQDLPVFAKVSDVSENGDQEISFTSYNCPYLDGVDHTMTLEMDPSYYDYSLCRCVTGYYGFPPNCTECPPQADCPGADGLGQPAYVRLIEGYYPTPPQMFVVPCSLVDCDNPDDIDLVAIYAASRYETETYDMTKYNNYYSRFEDTPACVGRSNHEVFVDNGVTLMCIEEVPEIPWDFEECFMASKSEHTCIGSDSHKNPFDHDTYVYTFECREGHFGRLCSDCMEDYYLSGRECKRCPATAGVATIFAILIMLVAVFVFFLIRKSPLLIRFLTTMKGLLFYLQSMNMLFSKTTLEWPTTVLVFNEFYQYANFSITIFSCMFGSGGVNYGTRFIIVVLAEVWLMMLAVVAFVAGIAYYKILYPEEFKFKLTLHFGKCMHFWFYQINFFYMPVCVRLLSVLNCSADVAELDDDGNKTEYMVAVPSQICSGSDFRTWQGMAYAHIPLFLLGAPGFFAIILFRYRNDLQKIILPFSFLFAPYKDHLFWYEIIIFVRRLVLAVGISLFKTGDPTVFCLIGLVLTSSLGLQLFYQPFKMEIVNKLETLSLSILNVSFVVGLIFSSAVIDQNHVAIDVLEVALIFANVLILFSFTYAGADVLFKVGRFLPERVQRILSTDPGGALQAVATKANRVHVEEKIGKSENKYKVHDDEINGAVTVVDVSSTPEEQWMIPPSMPIEDGWTVNSQPVKEDAYSTFGSTKMRSNGS